MPPPSRFSSYIENLIYCCTEIDVDGQRSAEMVAYHYARGPMYCRWYRIAEWRRKTSQTRHQIQQVVQPTTRIMLAVHLDRTGRDTVLSWYHSVGGHVNIFDVRHNSVESQSVWFSCRLPPLHLSRWQVLSSHQLLARSSTLRSLPSTLQLYPQFSSIHYISPIVIF